MNEQWNTTAMWNRANPGAASQVGRTIPEIAELAKAGTGAYGQRSHA